MNNIKEALNQKTPLKDIIFYSIGEGASSLAMNGIANFAMLYYTKVLGLSAKFAGLALFITLIWDAVTDPVMGHITDNTRSRFGRRHPYILIGGLVLAISVFFLWFVPEAFTTPVRLFWYILVINLFVRTAATVFMVPYTALGFEICTNYEERSKLQSVRFFLNQIVNFVGGALAWPIFFKDQFTTEGLRIDGTTIEANYYHVGIFLAVGSIIAVLVCVFFTRKYAYDTSKSLTTHNELGAFLKDFKETISDKFAVIVFACFGIASLGMCIVSQIQMFTYVDFMQFTARHKFFAHGGGMLAFALGSLLQAKLVTILDKKPAAYIGIAVCVIANIMLMIIFIGGILPPETFWKFAGIDIPISVIVFAIFQASWWGGCGMLVPLSLSMIADISEINYLKTGVLKDGSYSAVYSFVTKAAMGVGFLINGWLLSSVGYIAGAETQTAEVIRRIAFLTFTCGPIITLLMIPFIYYYPIDRKFMADVKIKLAEKLQQSKNP